MYAIGDSVLVHKMMGQEFDVPMSAVVIGCKPGVGLLEYRVLVPEQDRHVRFWCMRKWLSPGEIVINEVPESPFE